jgi:magnesium chelatase subunit I
MVYGALPTTLPIHATEDRVVGGWRIEELMQGKARAQPGLLELANERMLYVDEVNLLDDHLVNIILDVASTHVLVVQREGRSQEKPVRFSLVGTMNPEEGTLRPQLLDRFGLMVAVSSEADRARRVEILRNVLGFESASGARRPPGPARALVTQAEKQDAQRKAVLDRARQAASRVELPDEVLRRCVDVASAFQAEGHRGEQVMMLAARARAALRLAEAGGETTRPAPGRATLDDVTGVARLAIQHRRPQSLRTDQVPWKDEDDARVKAPNP